jgi:acetylornithine deacetylase/succinyl-diaminopimelate desuccinylase-like protein
VKPVVDRSLEAPKRVLSVLEGLEGELVELACGLVNVPSPPGYEKAAAEFLAGWLDARGIPAYVQDVEATRGNAVGRLAGSGRGRSVTFNGHLDTSFVGDAAEDLPVLGRLEDVGRAVAEVKEGIIYGLGIFNDKGPLAAAALALYALKASGVILEGDVVVAGVAGEIGRGQVGRYTGPGTRGKGEGTRFLIHAGVWTDYAIVCEPSNWTVSWALPGAAYFRVTTRGVAGYAPVNDRSAPSLAENKNAVVKLSHLMLALEAWADRYEAQNRYETPCGWIEPRVTLAAVDGGLPYKPNWRPAIASVYVDVRIPPNRTPLDVERELKDVVLATGLSDEVFMYLGRKGYVAEGVEPVAAAVAGAHRDVFGEEPKSPSWVELSTWNDSNIYAEVGIPVVKYGPPWPGGRYFPERMAVRDLMQAARVYALAALRLCSGTLQ